MDKKTIAFLIVSIILMSWMVYFYIGETTKDTNERNSFLQDMHTCPVCGWSGYVGLMNHTGGNLAFEKTTYTCPVCGYVLGVISNA
jgi:predicted RNA-binding Zn-ribbon protein involved in translation (DUF1610 family)